MSTARALADVLEAARAVDALDERCGCGLRVHRTRQSALLHEAIARYDAEAGREWAAEAPTKPDSGHFKT
ncbi:MAG: hypothetical protein WBY94_01780 [Polyangiaceae bacterium]